MRGAVSTVRTTLMLARQQAVTKHRTVVVNLVTSTNVVPGVTSYLLRIMDKAADGSYTPAHADAYLPLGIEFVPPSNSVTFYPSGKAGGVAPTQITVQEKSAYQKKPLPAATITVWPLTGVTKVSP